MSNLISELNFQTLETHRITDTKLIKDELVKYNNKCLGLELNTPGPQPVSVMVRNPEGECIGGVYADAYLNVLNIHGLWVHENYRAKGVAKKLLDDLILLAIKYECSTAVMQTHSFQMSEEFYHKLGVLFLNKIRNAPKGHSMYIMVNKIDKDKSTIWKLRNKIQILNSKIKKHMGFMKSK